MAGPCEPTDRRVRLHGPVALRSTSVSAAVTSIAVQGELDDAGAHDLRDEILRAVDGGIASITVDLSEAHLRAREAVDVLTLAAELMRNRGAVLVVVARDVDGRSLVVTSSEGGAQLAAALVPATGR